MKTFIFNIAILISLLAGISACSETDNEMIALPQKGSVRFILSGNELSRATDAGIDDLNENKIEKAYFFFFNVGQTNQPYVYRTPTSVSPANDGSVTLTIPNGTLLLDGTREYEIYVIANADFTDEQLNGKNLAALKSLPIADLEENIQSSFVMDGKLTTTLNKDQDNGTILLERAASKISLQITVADKVVVGQGNHQTIYEPSLTKEDGTSAMTVTMYNREKKGVVNGTAITSETLPAGERTIEQENGHVPFYSYSSSWNANDDSREAYLSLKIYWTNKRTGTILPYTYRIPVNDDTKELLRNHHYLIKLNVAILGSLAGEETEVELKPEYIIENWSEEELDVNMKKYKYLWVKDKYVVMNNISTIDIEYASSSVISPANFKILSVQRYSPLDEEGKNNNNKAESLIDILDHGVSFIVNTNGTFTVKHKIDPIQKNYYRPWYITFQITNGDGLTSDSILVVQNPAIYAVGNFNKNGNSNRFVNGDASGKYNSGTYYVYDDDATFNRKGQWNNDGYQLGSVNDISNEGDYTTNRNKNQYKIYVTVLDKDDDSCIGDPRTKEAVQFSGLKLTNYHPTATTNMNKVIAPSFLIASSWGITRSLKYENAKRRCAAYQENGYPAGRWRIPTEAEIKFVQNLSNNSYIPALFNGKYWASSGNAITSEGYEGSSTYVRCVYDLWFWGDEPMYKDNTKQEVITQFVWGDYPYTN